MGGRESRRRGRILFHLAQIESKTMHDKFVLLVDDNIDDIALTRRAFKKSSIPHRLEVVKDGTEALDFLFAKGDYASRDPLELPDLILLDLKLPKKNGIEVLKTIREDERTNHLLVVVLSTSLEEKDILDCYRLHVNSYIRKQVDFDRFMQEIQLLSEYWLSLNVPPVNHGEV